MGKSKALVLVFIASLLMIGCQETNNKLQDKEMEDWHLKANLDAEETPEELYAKAILEEALVIYTSTTRIYQVKESFEEEYPELIVEIHDAKASDIADIILDNYKNENYYCDIVIAGDDNGLFEEELLNNFMIYPYFPYDIVDKILPQNKENRLDFVVELEQLFYNSEFYDVPPIKNWWELTDPEWYGKVYMNSPIRSNPAFSLVHAVLTNAEVMEEAYVAHYGEKPNISQGSNAGKLFFERLVANGLNLTSSSNEVVEAIGTLGQEDPPVGFMISSKVRRTEIGLAVAPMYDTLPWDGVYSPNSVYIATGSENVNSAKLFIRWLLGETDGTGQGLQPYLLEGTWPVRNDVPVASAKKLTELNILENDMTQVIKNRDESLEFWRSIVPEKTEK